MELPFAGLHQLCAPMLAQLDALPDAAAERPARRPRPLVRRCPRSLPGRARCAHAARRGCRGTAAAVPGRRRAVARRRLGPGPRRSSPDGCWRSRWRSCSRCASRATSASCAGLPELSLGGLDEETTRARCSRASVPGRSMSASATGSSRETRGNPLALLELPRGMSAAELAGGFALPDAGDLPGQIEDHYRQRVDALPEATQRLMLLAAADPVGDATLVWRAAQTLGVERAGGGAGGRGPAAGDRSAGPVSPSAGQIGGVRRRADDRRAGRSRRARRRHRSGDRSRSAGLASSARGDRAGRGGGRGVDRFREPCPAPRRHRRRRSVPRASRDVHVRTW